MLSNPVTNAPGVNRILLVKRARIEELLILDYFNKYSEIYNELPDWYKKGKLNNKEDISHGLETAPESLVKLLNGLNLVKQLVKV